MFKKILTSAVLSLIAIGGFFVSLPPATEHHTSIAFISEAHGSSPTPVKIVEKSQEEATKDMYNKLVAALNILLDIITILVSPAIMLAGWLMSPDWTSGDLFNLRPTIHRLWVMVSNVTYFIYAILLIFIALATIFNSDKYGYKQLLPKLALGIILVPLTWWFVQFIISLATVVTASVINIPLETVQSYMNSTSTKSSWWESPSIPRKYEFYSEPTTSIIGSPAQYLIPCPDGATTSANCTSPKDILSSGAGMYSALLVYGNAVFKLNQVKELKTSLDSIKSVVGLVHKSIISVIMLVIFGLLVIALVFMLMMRAIKLWFYAMFSPLMTLKYVLGDGLFGSKENGESFDLKEFIGLAFVPALVGLALSFGLMIVTLLQTSDPTSTGVTCDVPTIMSPTGCEIVSIMGSPNNKIVRKIEVIGGGDAGDPKLVSVNEVVIGGMTFKFYGQVLGTSTDVVDTAASASGQRSVLSVTGGIFGTLIIDIIALVFIWVAFMAAKNVSKAASAVIEPFENMGKQIGKFGMSLPKYAPILPGGVSLKGAEKITSTAMTEFTASRDKKQMESGLAKALGVDEATRSTAANVSRINQLHESGDKIDLLKAQGIQKELQEIVKIHGTDSTLAQEMMKKFQQVIERSPEVRASVTIKDKDMVKGGRMTDEGYKLVYGNLDSTNTEVNMEAAKDAARKPNKNGSGVASKDTNATSVTATNIANTQLYKINLAGNTPIEWDNAKKELGEITKDMKTALENMTKVQVERGLKSSMADKDVDVIMDKLQSKVKFKEEAKAEEPKKPN